MTAVLYLERIFDIFIDLAICGEHSVRKAICSNLIMGQLLTRVVHEVVHSHESENEGKKHNNLHYLIAKWYVKLIIALTVSNQGSSSGPHEQ